MAMSMPRYIIDYQSKQTIFICNRNFFCFFELDKYSQKKNENGFIYDDDDDDVVQYIFVHKQKCNSQVAYY
mgnify:CR=1 FL=1